MAEIKLQNLKKDVDEVKKNLDQLITRAQDHVRSDLKDRSEAIFKGIFDEIVTDNELKQALTKVVARQYRDKVEKELGKLIHDILHDEIGKDVMSDLEDLKKQIDEKQKEIDQTLKS